MGNKTKYKKINRRLCKKIQREHLHMMREKKKTGPLSDISNIDNILLTSPASAEVQPAAVGSERSTTAPTVLEEGDTVESQPQLKDLKDRKLKRRHQSILKIRDHGEKVEENTELPSLPLPFEDTDTPDTDTTDKDPKLQAGHRIIDINYFVQELARISAHSSLFNCGLESMKLTKEKSCGLMSAFTFTCKLCKQNFEIKNTKANLNKNAVAGIMVAGCGHAQLKQVSASLDLPIMSEHTFNISHDLVSDEWEVTAWEEMKKAGEKERQAAIKEGRVNKDGIPEIDVIVDGCWCKRSYKTNYAALSGAATIIGRRFGQVLFMAVKNKYCCICARAEKRNETVKQHECFKNFTGPSTSMESVIAAEGFKLSIEMHGLIYARYIADGDSSTYAKILESRPYPSLTVEKIGCKNHILRNYCNRLQQLKSDTRYSIADRKLLTNEKILSARKYMCSAIKYYSSQQNKSENIKHLHKDISKAMFHAFDSHASCNKEICFKQSHSLSSQFSKCFLWQKIQFLTGNVANQARSLIENVDSNVVERLNGVIAKFVGGKRVNYALKRSYQARCAGAVISFNTGKVLSTVHKTIYNESPPKSVQNHENAKEAKRQYNQTLIRKKNRKIFSKKIDFDYGENATKPDLDPESFDLAKSTFLKNLEKTKEERNDIEKRTILQAECGEWLELRRSLLTASQFGKVIKRKVTNSCANIVKNMLYKSNIDHVASISHGKKNEKIALEQLSSMLNINIEHCGLFIDQEHPFLGATPDGITEDMVVEVKCPIAPYKMGIDAAIENKKMHFWRKDDKTNKVTVNKKSDWYFQAQGQMHICQKDNCLLAVWYGEHKIKTDIIKRDDKFWKEEMEPKLLKFYFDCLLPELVDPRFVRNMPIRDPGYVIKKNAENEEESRTNDNELYENVPNSTQEVSANKDIQLIIDFEKF